MLPLFKNDNKILNLILNTWGNDPNEIYDFSSNSIKKLRALIAESTYVVRTKNNIFQNIDQHADIDTKNEDLIFHVNNSNHDTFILINPIPKNLKLTQYNFHYLNNKIWYVLKTDNQDNKEIKENDKKFNEEYYLNENDLIKIGKVKYAVQKIFLKSKNSIDNGAEPPGPDIEEKYNISESNKNTQPVFDFTPEVKNSSGYVDLSEKDKSTEENKKKIVCQFCDNKLINQETDDGENFFISFCNCDLVHFKCLKDYLNKQMEIKEQPKEDQCVETMTFKNFECSKCSIQYPVQFKLPKVDKIFNLVDIKEPEDCDYMILESIDYKQYEQYYKSIHIIKFKQETIRIGRESDNDVIDRDISISRHHALLILKNEKICIRNLSKKFGTSVLIKKPIKILNKAIYLQVGRTYIEASLVSKEEYDKRANP